MFVRSKCQGGIVRLWCLLALFCAFSLSAHAEFRTVVIDPGHGAHDLGGSYNSVHEKHLALDTSYRLEKILKNKGFRTVLTRRSDQFISLSKRCAIANSYRDAIFVSIHYNFTYKKSVSGVETFFNSSSSRPLAQLVQMGLQYRTRCVNRGAKFGRYYVIRHTKAPAILVEGGFVTNHQDREHLKKGAYRQSIAQGIADGIMAYYKRTKNGGF